MGKRGRRPRTLFERFWTFMAQVEITDSCWLWRGRINKDGYGTFSWPGGGLAHRFAFLVAYDHLPAGVSDHQCHNEDAGCPGGRDCRHRRCVRPDHLRDVTQGENLRASGHGRVGNRPERELVDGVLVSTPKVNKDGVIAWGWYRIGVGMHLAGQRVTVGARGDELEVVAADGSLVRRLVLDRSRRYQPTGAPPGPRRSVA